MNPQVKDRRSDVLGMLTVVRDTGKRSRRAVIWECQCKCGRTKEVRANNLESGNTRSCGCMVRGFRDPTVKPNIEIRPGQAWTLPKAQRPTRTVHDVTSVFVDYADRGGVRQTRTVREFENWVLRYGAKVG